MDDCTCIHTDGVPDYIFLYRGRIQVTGNVLSIIFRGLIFIYFTMSNHSLAGILMDGEVE